MCASPEKLDVRYIFANDLHVGDVLVFYSSARVNRFALVLRRLIRNDCVNLWLFEMNKIQRWTPHVKTGVVCL